MNHLRELIADLSDDLKWGRSFAKTQSQLAAAARCAKEEILAGKAKPLDLEEL